MSMPCDVHHADLGVFFELVLFCFPERDAFRNGLRTSAAQHTSRGVFFGEVQPRGLKRS